MIVSFAVALPVKVSSPAPPLIVTNSPVVVFPEVKVTSPAVTADASKLVTFVELLHQS